MAAQLTSHIKEHGLDEKNQSACHCHHSTEIALVKVQNDLLWVIAEGLRSVPGSPGLICSLRHP